MRMVWIYTFSDFLFVELIVVTFFSFVILILQFSDLIISGQLIKDLKRGFARKLVIFC
jgi:hypothetical protein